MMTATGDAYPEVEPPKRHKRWWIWAVLALLVIGAVLLAIRISQQGGIQAGAPPRANDPVPVTPESSTIVVPVDMDQNALRAAIEQAVPRTLWTINKEEPRCIPPKHVKIFGARIGVTPAIGCTIVGVVTRGDITLHGQGDMLVADVPIRAQISARDVGGVLKGETATGSALAKVRIRFDLTTDWQPRAQVQLDYDWRQEPGIDFLGQRITFTDKADEKLAPIVQKLEGDLAKHVAQMQVREQVVQFWRAGFTSFVLNERDPPVWMRLTPRKLLYAGYNVHEGRIRFNLGMEAATETFVGDRPTPNPPTPLPNLVKGQVPDGVRSFMPVVADYKELEPVILRALQQRSTRPFVLPGGNTATARFERVKVYGTDGGRIAVGIDMAAKPDATTAETKGRVWLTAKPVNQPNSQTVSFTEVSVTGDTDGVGGDLLLTLGNSPGVSEVLASSLTQNFTKDVDDLMVKVRAAIANKRLEDFTIIAKIDEVKTGQLSAHGQGLYLPVWVSGSANVRFTPQHPPKP